MAHVCASLVCHHRFPRRLRPVVESKAHEQGEKQAGVWYLGHDHATVLVFLGTKQVDGLAVLNVVIGVLQNALDEESSVVVGTLGAKIISFPTKHATKIVFFVPGSLHDQEWPWRKCPTDHRHRVR